MIKWSYILVRNIITAFKCQDEKPLGDKYEDYQCTEKSIYEIMCDFFLHLWELWELKSMN